jgi:glycosyltransferase involved in cell wall biosynthesis
VPGEKIADALINHAGVPNEKISVIRPAVDMSFLSRSVESINYLKQYPQHNFFLLTRVSVGHKRDLAFILKVFALVVNRYTRTALMMMVPPEQVAAVKKIVAASHNRSIYVFSEEDDSMSYYGGAQIFLSIAESEEMTIPIACALSLHVPVVTTEAGVAKEIFSGSRYQEFMKPFGDVDGYSKAVFRLIENQQLRNEYRLNSPILLNSLTLQNPQGYVATILASIQERNK